MGIDRANNPRTERTSDDTILERLFSTDSTNIIRSSSILHKMANRAKEENESHTYHLLWDSRSFWFVRV